VDKKIFVDKIRVIRKNPQDLIRGYNSWIRFVKFVKFVDKKIFVDKNSLNCKD
jgi:hypothetical protein